MPDDAVKTSEQDQAEATPDTNVQVIPHFSDVGIVGLTIRLQPVRNEVIDKVLAVLASAGTDSAVIDQIEALRGKPKTEEEA